MHQSTQSIKRALLVAVVSIASILIGAHAPAHALPTQAGLQGADIDRLGSLDKAYERIAESVHPAIVNIQSTHVVKQQMSPMFNDPMFRQFFGGQVPSESREHALGSGVIVSPDGYIITNNHVIEHATDIVVMLPDRRTFKGRVVGADPQTDIAVIKVDAKNLPVAPLGDSSEVRAGDTVMAFGNPFGLNFTITRGSVSALGRSGLNIEHYENFIQTDAPINPGNSGGALVNMKGQVIGINTAIVGGSEGSGQATFSGVGLAIPSNVARHVMEELVKTGRVSRGYLGIRLSTLSPALAEQFHVPDMAGALVEDVMPHSPAEAAGLKAGDVIRAFNGKVVDSASDLQFMVAGSAPGTPVSLEVWRDSKQTRLSVRLAELPGEPVAVNPRGTSSTGTLSGLTVQDLTPSLRSQLNLSAHVEGVAITDISPGSPALQAGLAPGDVIMSVARKPVTSVQSFNRIAANISGQVLLRVNRQGNSLFVVVTPSEKSGQTPDNTPNE